MPEPRHLRLFLTAIIVIILIWNIGTVSGYQDSAIPPAPGNATDVRVIIILDTPAVTSEDGPAIAAGGQEQVLSGAPDDQPGQVISELQRLEANEIRDLPMFNAVSCQVSSADLETVKDLPGVARVVPDRIIRLLDEPAPGLQDSGSGTSIISGDGGGSGIAWGVNRINAPAVWDYGINGSGINVSVVDTGIYAGHPDLAGKVILWKDLVNDRADPYDDHGHGTHVAGTIAGSGAGGTKTGVAPGANLIVVKVFDANGSARISTLLAGFQWSGDHGADIISFSGGSASMDTLLQEQDVTVGAGNTTLQPLNVFPWFENASSFRPAWIAVKLTSPDLDDLNITLQRPDGSAQAGSPMTWLSPSSSDWFYQFADESAPLQDGTWDLTIIQKGTPGNHWWYSGKGFFQNNILTNESLDLSNVSSAHLQFLSKSDITEGQGYGIVEISPTGSTSWHELTNITGKVSRHIEDINISDYTGQPVMLRFTYVTTGQPSGTGWFVDDISIPEIGYRDTVENGTCGWLTAHWTLIPEQTTYHFPQYGIVVNYADNGTSPETTMADTLAADGILPVIAAGNEGAWGGRTIAAPGTSLSGVTVGATQESGDAIAGTSSRGPVGYGADTRIKPDVAAPGVNVQSTSWLGGYEAKSGTSMATPHVAGTAALMLQADPSLTPARIREILRRTAVDLGEPGPDNNYGAGRVNASAAVFNVTGWDMMRGDINNNGRTDISDVVLVAYMAARLTAPDGAADYNHNRVIDAGDAAKIAWYYVGKTPAL